MKKILYILLIITACDQKENDLLTAQSGLQPALETGRSVKITDDQGQPRFALQVADIRDSRCLMDAACPWAGNAMVEIIITHSTGTQIVRTLCLGDCAENTGDTTEFTTQTGKWRIILISVEPYPRLNTPDLPKTAVFAIKKTG